MLYSSNGSGRLPFEQKTRVRFPYRVQESEKVDNSIVNLKLTAKQIDHSQFTQNRLNGKRKVCRAQKIFKKHYRHSL